MGRNISSPPPHYGLTPSGKTGMDGKRTVKNFEPMRKTTTTGGWKWALLHAWIGFVLLLAFYALTFGTP
jgi:hypothetical protein